MTAPDPAGLAARLQQVTADLDGYIERRAADLAAPMIGATLDDAHARIRAAAMAVQRRDDVIAELRRRLDVLERWQQQVRDWQAATGCQDAAEYRRRQDAAGPGQDCGPRGVLNGPGSRPGA